MKNISIIIFAALFFNACSVTNQYKVTSDLKFEEIPVENRPTYVFFEKDQFVKKIDTKQVDFANSDFSDEFTSLKNDSDPFEGYNRLMTKFNDYLYKNVLNPVSQNYADLLNENVRISISNFFQNITFPIRFVNNILQLKFDYAAEETGRFVVNSTAGVLGFADMASDMKLEKKEEDFGQTLAYYGIGDGPHLVLPLFGPSNVRDFVGKVADANLNPLDYTEGLKYKIPENFLQTFAIKSVDTINETSLRLGQYENLKKDAIDLYPFLKDVYNQNRNKQIQE